MALTAIPGAAIFSPIDEAASAAAAGIPETSMGARHGPCPPACRGRRARSWDRGAGARGPRGRGARPQPELLGGGLPPGEGRGGAAARLPEREAAAAELAGVPRDARDPKPPGMVASEVRSCSPAGWCASWEGGGGEASHVCPAR